MRRLVIAPRAELRLREATAWLAAKSPSEETLVVGATSDAASEQIRAVAKARGAAFGFHRFTLSRLAAELAKLALVTQNLATMGSLAFEALCARVIDRLQTEGRLARLGAVADQPGLPRALARTLGELRMAGIQDMTGELGAALHAIAEELAAKGLADRARVFEIASGVAEGREPHLLLGHHVLLVDVRVTTAIERRFVTALVARAPTALATVPAGDERTLRALEEVCGVAAEALDTAADDALHRVQRHLFSPATYKAELDPSVHVMSAPGENRECVEIARAVLAEADAGVPYDRMAVLLRSPEQYRVHLEEALHRARIPIHFDRGTRKPDPSGRAILALLACAAENLSARRFAEYVSLGETPRTTAGGAPPAALRADDRWVPPDEELLPLALMPPQEGSGVPVIESLRTPTRWERLLVDAAVIGGRDRWARRLAGLEERIRLDDREAYRDGNERTLHDLAQLKAFALPLLDDLVALPDAAPWGVWIEHLTALATRALREPERVNSVLSALTPMKDVGPVRLHEVQSVLHVRLTELLAPPPARRYGKLFVAAIDAARGLAFDVVFVPGLAERMFPQKLVEDPLLLDAARAGMDLETRDDRLRDERLALRLAIGAANRRVVLSYPRIDLDQGRPRVPSFYGLEVLQAAEGALPGFDELGRRADATGAARIGWPAPDDPQLAIDEAEFDLGVLDEFVGNAHAPKGPARYLLTTGNEHLARALRTRARRWNLRAWKAADGLVLESPATKALLADHQPSQRSFSPTTLQHLAVCPYRFALKTIVGLEARTEPEPIEQLGPLERGSLIHEVQFRLLGELRAGGALPVRAPSLDAARDRLDAVLDTVAAEYKDKLYPAIERVWNDGIDAIRADLREWLRRMADDLDWTPSRFELAFGLDQKEGRDPASIEEPVELAIGIKLRGSIDLIEDGPAGSIRATDYKTGKVAVERGATIDGGKSLQPALYALALERMFPDAVVAGARLYYCTTRGDFTEVTVTLDDNTREAAEVLAKTLAFCLEQGFFPAAPAKDACKYCDYKRVCGPYEEMRLKKKDTKRLGQLHELRSRS